MTNYAIVGGGRFARHFSEYFRLLEIPHTCWTRDRRSRFNTFDLPGAAQRLKETIEGDPLQDLYAAFIRFHEHGGKQEQVQKGVQMEQAI